MKLLLLALLLVSPLSADFLIGENSGEISVLCEGQQSVFVSTPRGGIEKLALDENFGAQYVPKESGTYTFQCKNETKSAIVPAKLEQMKYVEGSSAFEPVLLLAAFLFSAAFAYFLARKFLLSRTAFVKEVKGNGAKLALVAGEKLEGVSIEDPVAMGYGGERMKHRIMLLKKGARWEFAYDIDEPHKALPAHLEAVCNGKRIALLSDLRIDGDAREHCPDATKAKGAEKKHFRKNNAPKEKRKLPKAE